MPRVDPYTLPLDERHADLRWVQPPADMLEHAEAVGFIRFANAKAAGKVSAFDEATSLDAHKMGAAGEAVFCWFYGIPWPATIDGYDVVPDLAPDIEIRTASRWDVLKVRNKRKDKADRRVTFVLHKDGSEWWYVSGLWVWAEEAQKHFPLTDPGNRKAPAHFVPKAFCRPRMIVPAHTIHVWEYDDEGTLWCYGGEQWKSGS